MRLFNPFLYEKVHLLIVFAFTFLYIISVQNKSADALLRRKHTNYLIFVYALLYIVVIGLRPISPAFGDTVNYARTFSRFSQIAEKISSSRDSIFYVFMWFCSQHMSENWFFFIVEIFYIVPIVIACRRLLRRNSDIGLLICFSAFSFFSYSVNGLRNGVSLSLVFLAMTFIKGKPINKIICAALCVLAFSIHASSALPILCMLAAYFIKERKVMFYFWALSIVLSLLLGDTIASLFVRIGFDERLTDYIHPDIEGGLYTRTGFRWDFLLYSAAPIILGYYLVIKKRVFDSTYLLLLGTYMFANAFWIMIIRAEFSNRFAYLSWFLYPIVIAYPLLKLKIWPKTQGTKASMIMLGHLAFTFLMVFLS